MNKKFLNITRSSPRASISSLFLQVLDNLSRCEQNGLIPIINFTNTELLCYDTTYGKNVWEYYFHPVSEYSLEEAQKIGKVIRSSKMSKPQHLNYYLGKNGQLKAYKKKFKNNSPPDFDTKHRQHFKNIIDKYIRIKDFILEEKNILVKNKMENKKTVGILIRGTNKFNEKTGISSFKDSYKATIENYVKECYEQMKKIKADNIYMACDSHEAAKIFAAEFGDMLIYQKDCMRYKYHYSNIDPPWDDPEYGPMNGKTKGDMGKENIIDTLCLADCDFIIHPETNITIAAMLYNPTVNYKYVI